MTPLDLTPTSPLRRRLRRAARMLRYVAAATGILLVIGAAVGTRYCQ